MKKNDIKNLVGCCGLFCGLCSKYQSKAPSRCIGCSQGEQHSWCSIWNCCVKKHGFANCAECDDIFHCDIFVRRKVAEWIPAADNLRQIKVDLDKWLNEQKDRQIMLEELMAGYNEGRSMSFYCDACARLPIDLINEALHQAKEKISAEKSSNVKSRAGIVKAVIMDLAFKAAVNLK